LALFARERKGEKEEKEKEKEREILNLPPAIPPSFFF